jgi:hypothetical protein
MRPTQAEGLTVSHSFRSETNETEGQPPSAETQPPRQPPGGEEPHMRTTPSRQWLAAALAAGPLPAAEVAELASAHGINRRTLGAAKERVAVSIRCGFGPGGRVWWVLKEQRHRWQFSTGAALQITTEDIP